MKLGSLFDGIGGFPLSATLHSIEPVWASEIEKFPIEVTKTHFPNMKHLGDITQINGAEIKPVDIITFGSPCQDLSVAGKRAGLEGKRSNLFHRAVEIIREMREATNGVYPRFAIWENVPGAFSSNGGQDFRAVLEEIAESEIPMPASGRWATAGMVRGDGRSLAWRVLDAQYWGVPQRRKRIFLVADFAGQSAGEILLEQQGMSGHLAESGEAREEVAAGIRECAAGAIAVDAYNHTITGDITATLNATSGATATRSGPMCLQAPVTTSWSPKMWREGNDVTNPLLATDYKDPQIVIAGILGGQHPNAFVGDGKIAPTITEAMGMGGGHIPIAGTVSMDGENPKTCGTLSADYCGMISNQCVQAGHAFAQRVAVAPFNTGQVTSPQNGNKVEFGLPCHTLSANEHPPSAIISYGIQGSMIGRADKNGPQGDGANEDVSFTLNTTDHHAVAYGIRTAQTSANGHGIAEDKAHTLDGAQGQAVAVCYDIGEARLRTPSEYIEHTPCLSARMGTGGNNVPAVVAGYPDPANTLMNKGCLSHRLDTDNIAVQNYTVRRLTPTECERLQGFPDNWTSIPGASDTGRYKALGNSVAVPCVAWIIGRIKEATQCEK